MVPKMLDIKGICYSEPYGGLFLADDKICVRNSFPFTLDACCANLLNGCVEDHQWVGERL